MRITDLEPGEVYVVVQSFRDDRGVRVLEGDRQTLDRVNASRGSFEVVFREETLHLDEERQTEVCEHAERFFRLAT